MGGRQGQAPPHLGRHQEKPGNPGWKANWFDRARSTIVNTMPELGAFIYYHALAPKGGDFWADTTAQALASFRRMGQNAHFPSPA